MKKTGITFLCGVLLAAILAGGASKAAAQQKVITLKAITCFTVGSAWNKLYEQWIENVNTAAKGRLRIEFMGGPEVVSPFKNVEPVRDGVYDLALNVPGYFAGLFPDPYGLHVASAPPMELRKAGIFDFLDGVTRRKFNLTLIGACTASGRGSYLTNRPFTSLATFKGFRVRSVGVFNPVTEALGNSPVDIPIGETYGALQKGLVDGVVMPIDDSVFQNALDEVCTHVLYPGIRQFTPIGNVWMNAKRFDALPKDMQELLVKETIAIEPKVWEWFGAQTEVAFKKLKNKGLKFVELSPEEANKLDKIYFDSTWAWYAKRAPDTAAKLRDLIAPYVPK